MAPVPAAAKAAPLAYAQRGTNILQHVFRDHFGPFVAQYDSRYAKEMGTTGWSGSPVWRPVSSAAATIDKV